MSVAVFGSLDLLNPDGSVRLGREVDFGAPETISAVIQSVFTDGERVVGDRSGNRLLTLPILLRATSRLGLAQAEALLALEAKQPTNTLTLAPEGALPVVFDTFRGQLTATSDPFMERRRHFRRYTLTVPALPFARSTEQVTVVTEGTQVQLDSMDTAQTGWGTTAAHKIEGSYSLARTLSVSSGTTFTAQRTFAAKDLSDCNVVQLWAMEDHVPAYTVMAKSYLTLFSGTDQARWSTAYNGAGRNNPGSGLFTPVRWTLDDSMLDMMDSGFDISAVTGYTLDLYLESISGYDNNSQPVYTPMNVTVWIDDLRALPPSSDGMQVANGAVLQLPDVIGSARAPVNIDIGQADPDNSFSSFVLHRPPAEAPIDAWPIRGLTVPPTGDQVITIGRPGRYRGTYSVILVASAMSGSSTSRTVTMLFELITPYNPDDVTTPPPSFTYSATLERTFTPSDDGATGKLINMGEITLPLVDLDPGNDTSYYKVTITASNGADTFADFLLLDTRGQTVITRSSFTQYHFYVDEPPPGRGVGRISGGRGRSNAVSVMDGTIVTGGPICLDPGANILAVYSPQGAPAANITYYPRWHLERAQ